MSSYPSAKKPYYYHIDLLRFLFSILIVYYHLLHSNIMPYVTDPVYTNLAVLNNYSENIVVCFFVMGGVFLYRSWQAEPDRTVFEFLMGRVVRLWPVLMVSMLVSNLITGNFNWNRLLIDSFFLQCSGLSLEYRGLLWYVSSFFFASLFLYTLLKTFSYRPAMLTISLSSYFCCVFLINFFGGSLNSRETVLYVLNTGILRGVGFMGVGILIAAIRENLSGMFSKAPLSRPVQIGLVAVSSVTEILCLSFLFRYFLNSPAVGNHIIVLLVFSILMFCMLCRFDPMGFLLNRRSAGYCGRFAYSIYVMQGTGFCILQKTLWLSKAFTGNIPLALIGSTLFVVLLGVAAYYLVELPCTNLYRKWRTRYRAAERKHTA